MIAQRKTLGREEGINHLTAAQRPTTELAVATPITHPGWADDVGHQVTWLADQGSSSAELVLTPPHLGRIEISLQIGPDQSSAQFFNQYQWSLKVTKANQAWVPSNGAAPSAIASGKGSKRILTVGNDIMLNGEIASCDRIVIEGRVDANLKEVHTVEIAESGSFKGKAEIEDAEISGVFDGELVVRNRLTIYSTGKVRGKIAYGEIEDRKSVV